MWDLGLDVGLEVGPGVGLMWDLVDARLEDVGLGVGLGF